MNSRTVKQYAFFVALEKRGIFQENNIYKNYISVNKRRRLTLIWGGFCLFWCGMLFLGQGLIWGFFVVVVLLWLFYYYCDALRFAADSFRNKKFIACSHSYSHPACILGDTVLSGYYWSCKGLTKKMLK